MRPIPNRGTIALVGYWNRMIFVPAWVGPKLFNSDKIEVQVPVAPVYPTKYVSENCTVEVAEDRVVF